MDIQTQVRLGNLNDAVEIAGISRSEIWRRIAAGTFPQPVRFGTRCTRFPLHEIEAWVQQQLDARNHNEQRALQDAARARVNAPKRALTA